MATHTDSGAALFQEEDYARFNYWLWITRLRSIAGLLLIGALVKWVTPEALAFTPIALVCAAALVPSLGYQWWLRTRRHLRSLAYVQLTIDTTALIVGLAFVPQPGAMFHFLLLLVVVPASMIEWQCGVVIALLASVGHFLLLALEGATPWSVAGILPPASFFLIAGQSLFYAQHVAQKNRELARAAHTVHEANVRLEEEAAISGALVRTAQALTTSLDPRDILERLNEEVRTALGCEWSITLLYDAPRGVYRVAAVSGSNRDIVDEVRTVEFPIDSAPLFARVAVEDVVAVEDRSSPLFSAELMARWRLGSFLCATLRRAGTGVGLLAAGFSERTGPFSPRERRLFGSIAQQAAVALENARLVESLRAASRLKSEFIGTMSHELRSPLNVVIGYVDLLLGGDMGSLAGEQADALERVRKHALQLLELIQETLDINRLEAGLLPVDLETFTVHEFFDDVKAGIPADWFKPNVVLAWEAPPAPTLLRSDRAKLKKVLRNLIHNALKFTDRGAVTVAATSDAAWVEISVTDTGIGIDPESLPVIFDMFRQVDGSTTRRHGGVGLGLYIVRQLVRSLGAEITVTSTAGEGSAFRVRLRRGEPKAWEPPGVPPDAATPPDLTDGAPPR